VAGRVTGRPRRRDPVRHRLLLRAYPRRFRSEYATEILAYLERQRREPRYAAVAGSLRFWWDATRDALGAGLMLRVERGRSAWTSVRMWWRHRNDPGLPFVGRPQPEKVDVAMRLDAIGRDIRHSLRGLAKNPGYAAVFIITLGLGIGANTAMFSAVNGVLLRPLPHQDGDRLVYVRQVAATGGVENALFSVPEIEDYREGSPSFEAMAEFSALTFTMLGFDEPRRVRAGIVTGNYFGVMGLSARLGRVIGLEDDGAAAAPVIVLSDRYWREMFGADPDILGTTVRMNGLTATFVGVAEPAPPYPERTDIYVNMATSPHHLDATMNTDRVHRMTEVFARLAPGATIESAKAETELVSARIHQEYPESYDAGSGYGVTLTPLKTQLTRRARPTFLLLLGTAAFVLVIACANLANLTLTRVLRRGHELAIRVSLGGSRGRLRRTLLIESLILAMGGALVGLALAAVGLNVLVTFAERFTSRASEISLDASVFGFALLVAVTASIFFSVLPPLPDGRRIELTRHGARSTGGSSARTAQRALVVAQIGTSFVLLVGAGLLVRSLLYLNRTDPGFDTTQILSLDIPPSLDGTTEEQMRTKYLGILDDVGALPGVQGVALTAAVPLTAEDGGFTSQMEMTVEGHVTAPGAPATRADFRVVSPGYFRVMGIDLIAGREFVDTDREDAQDVVIINESMARTYFGDRDPIGRRIAWTDPVFRLMGFSTDWRTVVGVVGDTRDGGLDADVVHAMYNPYRQVTPLVTGSLVVRVAGPPAGVTAGIREAIRRHDPNQPIDNVATIAELGAESVAPRRLNTILLGSFAALALVIAAVGIGGVLAFSVGSRRREFGVRSALGAARHQIWSGVIVEGAKMAAIGVACGAVGAVVLTRFVSGLLLGVPALDPLTFVAVGVLLGGVAVGAAWLPAWRAASVSPLEAIESD